MKNENQDSSNTTTNKSRLLENRRWVFDGFEFYPHQQKLLYQNKDCLLEPKMLLLLELLIENRPRVVTKELLMEKLWPDAVVSDWSLARLVSDTRKLIEDDGKQQSIIKTVRGKGFSFAAQVDEIIQAYDSPESPTNSVPQQSNTESAGSTSGATSRTQSPSTTKTNTTTNQQTTPTQPKSKIAMSLVVITLLALITVIYNNFFATQSIHDQAEHRLEVMYEIQKNLRLTKTTYLAQKRRRSELKSSLLAKSPEKTPLSSERRIKLHFPHLTSQERFVFDQIRAMTEGPMYQGNIKILKLLEQHPELFREIESFHALYNHLSIWKSKFERVFVHQPDMCFVFVGEEDGVPFPSEIDGLVDDWINLQSMAQ